MTISALNLLKGTYGSIRAMGDKVFSKLQNLFICIKLCSKIRFRNAELRCIQVCNLGFGRPVALQISSEIESSFVDDVRYLNGQTVIER